MEKDLTLSQMTNFRLFQTERVCRQQFQNLIKMAGSFLKELKTPWEKEKLLVASNFSFSHGVFKRLVVQTHKNQGLFGIGLIDPLLSTALCESPLGLRKAFENS